MTKTMRKFQSAATAGMTAIVFAAVFAGAANAKCSDAQPPVDRSPDNGVRCARYLTPPDAGFLTPTLFRLLGAPEKDKKFVLLEYAHNVGALPNEMRREVLTWLDRYLGPVK